MSHGFRWVTTIEEFNALESQWRDVFASNASHSVFLSWEWISNWWQYFGQDRSLKILCVDKEGGQTVAIAPFCVIERTIFKKAYLREWVFLGAESTACSDHLGYLVRPGIDERLIQRMLDEVWAQVTGPDLLRLTDLRPRGGIASVIERWAGNNSVQVEKVAGQECPLVQLPDAWETFISGLSKKFRAEVRLKTRRVSGNAELQMLRILTADEARHVVDDLVRLSKLRLADMGIRSTLSDSRMEAFLKVVVPAMVDSDLAWLDMIKHGDRTVAVTFHMRDGDSAAFYQGGFDPEYAWYSPLIVLLAHVIERSISGGYRYYDFLRGSESYKFRWGAEVARSDDLLIQRRSAYATVLRAGGDYLRKIGNAISSRFGNSLA
jgi:CelD/BcsL family acetyltransferase involved in cellulose biosynthesis